MAAGEAPAVARLQASLIERARPYPALWQVESGQRLRYAPAGLSMPLVAGGVGPAVSNQPAAGGRRGAAGLCAAPGWRRARRVQLRIGYMETLRGQDGAQRPAWLESTRSEPYGEQVRGACRGGGGDARPALRESGADQVRAAFRPRRPGRDRSRVVGGARRLAPAGAGILFRAVGGRGAARGAGAARRHRLGPEQRPSGRAGDVGLQPAPSTPSGRAAETGKRPPSWRGPRCPTPPSRRRSRGCIP